MGLSLNCLAGVGGDRLGSKALRTISDTETRRLQVKGRSKANVSRINIIITSNRFDEDKQELIMSNDTMRCQGIRQIALFLRDVLYAKGQDYVTCGLRCEPPACPAPQLGERTRLPADSPLPSRASRGWGRISDSYSFCFGTAAWSLASCRRDTSLDEERYQFSFTLDS